MELENNEAKPVSVLQGDKFCTSRILARETSAGQSSRIFYRAAEGVPFKWEMQPGTPKIPQEEDFIPPPCPSPLMQNLGLHLPNLNLDEPKDLSLKASKIWKMVKKRMKRSNKMEESSRFGDSLSDGELVAYVKDSSFSSYSSSFSPDRRRVDSSRLRRDSVDCPFCCSPWNMSALLDEGNTRIYYCRQHKKTFTAEEDTSFLCRIQSRTSAADNFSGPFVPETLPTGVPFDWETQPGTPKNGSEIELIPPPNPPPVLQSSSMPQLRIHVMNEEKASMSKWTRAWFWMKTKYKIKRNVDVNKNISFRYPDEASFRESASVSSLTSVASVGNGSWRISKMRRRLKGGYFSCGSWSRREIIVFARKKMKSLTF